MKPPISVRVGEEVIEFGFGEGLLFFVRESLFNAPTGYERVELIGG